MHQVVFNKLLPIFFSCHQKPERSFFYKGKQLPICARCTGILAGYFVGIVLFIILGSFKWFYTGFLTLPMLADGIIQQLTKYESTNLRRVITGCMFGIASIQIIVYIHLGTVKLAITFLKFIK